MSTFVSVDIVSQNGKVSANKREWEDPLSFKFLTGTEFEKLPESDTTSSVM